MDHFKYNVEVIDNGQERYVSCVNFYKHRLYRGLVQTIGKGHYMCLFEILAYPYPYTKSRLHLYKDVVLTRTLFELTNLTQIGIKDLRSNYPLELLHQAFKIAVPELYLYNRKVQSNKYKRLVSDYSELEEQYLRKLDHLLGLDK